MNNRWIGSVAMCIIMLALSSLPSAAKLNEGKFIPFSQAVSSIADRQVILYRIEKGDTLSGIARRYNVNLNSLMITNNVNARTVLQIGNTLKIPDNRSMVHVIAAGDTISKLAEYYQVNSSAIVEANPDKNPDALVIGDCLQIPVVQSAESSSQPSRASSQRNKLDWPVIGKVSCAYGPRKSGFHHGIDIAADLGTPIHAAAAGTVSWAGYLSVYGRTVIIDHPDGKQTLYAHAQQLCVKKGDKVSRGQVISLVGISGRTTGPHVHFEVRVDKKARDPVNYLERNN